MPETSDVFIAGQKALVRWQLKTAGVEDSQANVDLRWAGMYQDCPVPVDAPPVHTVDTPGTDYQKYVGGPFSGTFQPRGPTDALSVTPLEVGPAHYNPTVADPNSGGTPSGATGNVFTPSPNQDYIPFEVVPPFRNGVAERGFDDIDVQSPGRAASISGNTGLLVQRIQRSGGHVGPVAFCQEYPAAIEYSGVGGAGIAGYVGARQLGQRPPTMGSVTTGIFEIGDRVLVSLFGPGSTVVRGAIIDVPNQLTDLYLVLLDYAVVFGDALFFSVSEMRFEGGQTLLATGTDSVSLEASANASTTLISPGDTGQVVVTGFGLGLLANLPGIRTIWASQLIPTGVIISGINGDGFSRFVVNWEVPVVTGTILAQASMGAFPLAIIVVVLGILAALGLLGWLITKVDVLLNGSPGTPPTPFPAGAIVPPKQVAIVVGPDGKALDPGTAAPPGSYQLGEPKKPGLFPEGSFVWIAFATLALVAVNTFKRRG